jgi:hypothetical protein
MSGAVCNYRALGYIGRLDEKKTARFLWWWKIGRANVGQWSELPSKLDNPRGSIFLLAFSL